MKLYAYCVAECLSYRDETIPGLADRLVRYIEVEELIVAVSEFQSDNVGVTRQNILRHDAVVRRVLTQTTPLPFRFGTLVTEESLRSFVTARRNALLERLALVHDAVEMSVKIIWQQIGDDPPPIASQSELGVGAAFLQSKRDELRGNERLATQANEIAEWLAGGLQDLIRKQVVNIQPTQKLVIAGSYLIDRSSESGFRGSVSQLESQRPELHFLTSGPWPPYTFANIDLEFETQFGVS